MSDVVGNPEDRFSHNEAHMYTVFCCWWPKSKLRILQNFLGDKVSTESKIATLATMYGMVMHSRNVKACGIQRIFTALAIRFHADNKV